MSERQEFKSNTCETCADDRSCMSPAPKKCKAWQPSAWFTVLQAEMDENAALKENIESVLYIWRTYDALPSTTDEQIDKKNGTLHELFDELKRVDKS